MVGDDPVTLLFTQPRTPLAGSIHTPQFKELAKAGPRLGERLVICGDLNTVPWSAPVRRLKKRAGLRDAYDGRGPHWSCPTWNTVLGIPLDTCLLSAGLVAVSRTYGPKHGSDHRPLIIELGISEASDS